MKKIYFFLLAICLMGGAACNENELKEEKEKICNVDNPLTDLPWLKEKIDEFNLLAQKSQSLSIAIYQCKYGNEEIGFLIDEGNTKPFYNCNGEILCIMGGDAGETCSELNIVSKELIWEINYPIENYPIKIPFTEYSLVGTSCQWKNLEYNGEIIIINSNEELENYIDCSGNGYPVVDFTKNTLLLVSGDAGKVIHTIDKSLQQLSTNKYKLYIEITVTVTKPSKWTIALIVSKITNGSIIELESQLQNILDCGVVNDPLQNIEWLREYCESIDMQYYLSMSIDLYKVIGKDEHIFYIYLTYPWDDPPMWDTGFQQEWRDCTGKTIYCVRYPGVIPEFYDELREFSKNIEFVAELFRFVKQ